MKVLMTGRHFGSKTEMIKAIRNLTGFGLRESKAVADVFGSGDNFYAAKDEIYEINLSNYGHVNPFQFAGSTTRGWLIVDDNGRNDRYTENLVNIVKTMLDNRDFTRARVMINTIERIREEDEEE